MSHYKASDRPTHTIEDYLMTMHVMDRDYGEIIAARLAEMFGVTPATVAMTLKRMERDNWITGKGRKDIHLTETGRTAAKPMTRHMASNMLFLLNWKGDYAMCWKIRKFVHMVTLSPVMNTSPVVGPRLPKSRLVNL